MSDRSDQSGRMDILLVDDEVDFLEAVAGHLEDSDHQVVAVDGPKPALEALSQKEFDLAILDVRMPGGDGIDLLGQIRRRRPGLQVIILTGHSSIRDAVRAIRLGALDYLSKPIAFADLDRIVERVLEVRALRQQALSSREGLAHRRSYGEIVGSSSVLFDVLSQVDQVAPTEATVLLEGESGTGKELFARAIHRASQRSNRPLVVLGATTVSEELIESELFGHEKGAFTGAVAARDGLIGVADGGTLFIDEIGEMSLSCQARLLRVLECGDYRRVGAAKSRTADLRIIAATNRCLAEEVKRRRFREDLFFRLAVFRLQLPPLRERPEDIPLLVEHFAARLGHQTAFEPAAMGLLKAHSWPGNVRELAHVVERALIAHRGETVGAADIIFPGGPSGSVTANGQVMTPLAQVEAEHISRVLAATGGNKRESARILGISLRNLYRKIERFAIDVTT